MFAMRSLTPSVSMAQKIFYEASRKLIELFVAKATVVLLQLENASYYGNPIPLMEMEVYCCPDITANGYEIKDNSTHITKNDKVIISDGGAGTIFFDKDDLM